MPGDEDHAPRLRSELGCHRLGERAPLRGHQHKAHVAVARTQILYCTKHGLWLDHHPSAAAVGIVISDLVTPLRIVSQVHRTDVRSRSCSKSRPSGKGADCSAAIWSQPPTSDAAASGVVIPSKARR